MPSPNLRASDADRQAVVAELQRHYSDGRLSTEELRQRVSQALASRTYADLDALQRDLPHDPLAPKVAVAPAQWLPATVERRSLLAHGLTFLLVNAGLIIIWLLTSPGGYFWPEWPLLGWGIGLGAHAISYSVGRGRRRKVEG